MKNFDKKAKKLTKSPPLKTLPDLVECAKRALSTMQTNSFEIPAGKLKIINDGLEFRRLHDLMDLGKSYLAYLIVAILRRRLPSKVLSRGSLTVRVCVLNQLWLKF